MGIKNYIYSFEEFESIKDSAYWGEPKTFSAVSGDEAARLAANEHIPILGKLIGNCQYVFRYNLKKSGLVPLRVSMHPKTMENIKKGSNRYGTDHIKKEL